MISLVGLAACSNGGDSDSGALTTSERKYCTMVKQFKDRMPTVPKDAEPEQFIAQMSESMRKNNDYFNELLKVAPTEIKADVEKTIAALQRVAGGDITAYDGLDLTKADEWEEAHCNKSS
jgi:O6-methylguanine-DNA--protein-cysteine methyltransferase